MQKLARGEFSTADWSLRLQQIKFTQRELQMRKQRLEARIEQAETTPTGRQSRSARASTTRQRSKSVGRGNVAGSRASLFLKKRWGEEM